MGRGREGIEWRNKHENIVMAMRVGCARSVDCLYTLHGKGFKLDEACSKCGMGSDHVFE